MPNDGPLVYARLHPNNTVTFESEEIDWQPIFISGATGRLAEALRSAEGKLVVPVTRRAAEELGLPFMVAWRDDAPGGVQHDPLAAQQDEAAVAAGVVSEALDEGDR